MRAVPVTALRLGLVTLVAAVVVGASGTAYADAAGRDTAVTLTGPAGTAVVVAEGAASASAIAVTDASGRAVPAASLRTAEGVVTVVAVQAKRPVTITCGVVTCSIYFSRAVTRRMVTPAGVVAVVTSLCGHAICKVIAAATGIVAAKASEAAGKNQCLRVRFGRTVPPGIVGLYSDKSRYCMNT
jgi:hypothetical protein